jgi:hypothetical protein
MERVFLNAADAQNAGEVSSGAMAKLRSIIIEGIGTDIPPYLPYLKLQSVKTLRCHGILDDGFVRPEGFISGATELSIRRSSLTPGALHDFLLCFPFVKKLECELNDEVGAVFVPSTFSKALAHLKPCLEELLIVSSDNGRNEIGIEQELWGPIGALSNFEKLRKLEATACILLWMEEWIGEQRTGGWHWDVSYPDHQVEQFINGLPPSLESLTIRDCYDAVYEVVAHSVARDAPANLKSMQLVFRVSSTLEFPPMNGYQNWEELEKAAKGNGIKVTRQKITSRPLYRR